MAAKVQRLNKDHLVKIDYVGKFKKSKEVFDSTEKRGPLEVIVGQNQLIQGFEKKILGLKAGNSKTFTLKPGEAYGEKSEEKIVTIPRNGKFKDLELKEGALIYATAPTKTGEKKQIPVKVVSFDEKNVTIDYNHPLAGEELTFKVTIVEVTNPEVQKQAQAAANLVKGEADKVAQTK